MALIDVTQILTDPDLVDTFSVLRRAQVTDSKGRVSLTTQTFNKVIGVVTSISPNSLDRQTDYQTFGRGISIVTKFRLQGEVTGFQPDIVVWRGDNFVVKAIDNYPQMGPGFFQVECSSQDKVDLSLPAPANGAFSFNKPANAVYVGVSC